MNGKPILDLAENIVIFLLFVAACKYLYLLIRWINDKSQPSSICCPNRSCNRSVDIKDTICENCKNEGTLSREVTRFAHGSVVDNYFKCRVCRATTSILRCPHCGTYIQNLFYRK